MNPARPTPNELSQARQRFESRGESIAEWSRNHGFSRHLVYAVLSGRCVAKRGQAHHIAVALSLKPPST